MLSIRPQPSCRCMTALAACATKNGASRFSRTTEVTRLGDADAVRPGADEDLGPGVPESPGDGQADAAGAAGDEGNPARTYPSGPSGPPGGWTTCPIMAVRRAAAQSGE